MISAPERPAAQPPLDTIRHSAAHVMAHAVKDLYPETLVTIGPATDQGFYYDFDRKTPFGPDDLAKIEERMKELVAADLPIVRREISRDDAIAMFEALGETYKVEIISAIPAGDPITLYTLGSFTDLCRGPHVEHTRPNRRRQGDERRRGLLARRRAQPDAATHLRHRVRNP